MAGGYLFHVRMTAWWILEHSYFLGLYNVENFNIACNLSIFNDIDLMSFYLNHHSWIHLSIPESEEVEYILLLKSFFIIVTTFEDFSLYASQV